MINTITEYQFTEWFMEHRPDNYSYEGTKALFDYLEDLEDGLDIKMEFDPIAICCEYDEYNNLQECLKEYENLELKSIDDLRDRTQVIEIKNSDKIIIAAF
jgi:hypothetical protein|tara:strand:+ start:87 stop:389 length:303 start_codon:yes stop_codon:yes gene_type:complete